MDDEGRTVMVTPFAPVMRQLVHRNEVPTTCTLLGNERRQYVILYLLTRSDDERIPVRKLAKWVAACEEEVSVVNASPQAYKRAKTALTQSHLHPLADADIISYDEQRALVSRGLRCERIGRTLLVVLLTLGISGP